MDHYIGWIRLGQILLIVCCIFYLIWWSVSFRPDEMVSRTGGWRGILLLITAACGIGGIVLSTGGLNLVPKTAPPKMNGVLVCLAGLAVYFILMAVTAIGLKRPVTTELLLITGWAVLELSVINAQNSAGTLSDARFYIGCVIIAAAFVISMILYVLYYRMEEWKAFYAAMVPLITEGVSMLALLLMAA